MDPIKKLNEIKNVNEKLFSEAWPGKNQNTFNYYKGGAGNGFVKTSDGRKNEFKFFSDKNLEYVVTDEDIWTDGGILHWLTLGNWNGDHVIFDKYGIKFSGLWVAGDFKGYSFFSKSKPFSFQNGRFMGKFYKANNLTYKAGPANYYSGAFMTDVDGVLGKEYLKDGLYNSGSIDIYLINTGKYFIINDAEEFYVKKSLGREGTDFIFQNTKAGTSVPVPWETIRNKYELGTGAIQIGKGYTLAGVMNIAKINSIEISDKSKFKAVVAGSDAGKDSFNLKWIGLKDEDVALDTADPTQKAFVDSIVGDMESGQFAKNINRIKKLIGLGLISGHGGKKSLAPLFNGVSGDYKNMSGTEKEEVTKILNYLSGFVMYFMNAIKSSAKAAQVNAWLKRTLNVDKYIQKQKTVEPISKPVGSSVKSGDSDVVDYTKTS